MTTANHRATLRSNIERDQRKGALDPSIIQLYLPVVADESRTVWRAFEHADAQWDTKGQGDALCSGTRTAWPTTAELVRVMKLDVFVEYNTDHVISRRSAQNYLGLLTERAGIARKGQKGPLRGERNVFWMTLRTALTVRVLNIEPEELADRVPSLVGLRFPPDVHVITLEFPPRYFDMAAIPTFVDGGPHPAFRNWDDETDGVGYTWNLLEQARGLPEIVAQNYTLDARATVNYIGRTRKASPIPEVF